MRKSRVIATCLALALATTSLALAAPIPAGAIYQGQSALGSATVVKIFSAGSGCSGGLISRRIVVTAAHCLVTNGRVVALNELRVYMPGVDVGQRTEFARALGVFHPAGFINSTNAPEPNDIAFITLDRDLPGKIVDGLADSALVAKIAQQGLPMQIYGYGALESGGVSSLLPFSFSGKIMRQLRYFNYVGFERTYINFVMDQSGAACPGDSGGPITATYQERTYLIGVISGGSGPCSTTPQKEGSATATVAGEYLNLFNEALASLNLPKPNAPNSALLSSNTFRAELSWREGNDPDKLISSYIVSDQSGRVICRTVELSCAVLLRVGANQFAIQASSARALSDPIYISTELRLPAPESIILVGSGLTRQLQWQPPVGYQEIISGYLVTNESGSELCRSASLQCPVVVRTGENSFSIRAFTADGSGDLATSTFAIRNATTPQMVKVAVLTLGAKVLWDLPKDYGDAAKESIRVEIRDGMAGPILCSANIESQECIFDMKKKTYQLTIGFTSDLGESERVVSQKLDGSASHKIRSESISLAKDLTSKITNLKRNNPGYKSELDNLANQIIAMDSSVEYTSSYLAELKQRHQRLLNLQKRIKSNPRLISISCYKGSLVKKITAVNPRCPKGYRTR